jgi:hypothetical protein
MKADPGADPIGGNDDDVLRALERAAELEREVVAESRAPAAPREVQAVEGALRGVWETKRRPFRSSAVLIAATLVLATFAVWRALSHDEAPDRAPNVVLGRNEVRILAPEGPVEVFTVLRWQTTTRGTPSFEVRIYDDATGALLLRESDLRATELSLDNRATEAWQRVRIEIDELDSTGELVKAGRGSAWLRSP